MPRVKRRHLPGVLMHVIVRFVDGQFIMDAVDGARPAYLARLDRALRRSDWVLCWYALMGTHVHLGLVCGEDPLEAWARSLHSGWANWINSAGRRRGGRNRGPVLADRPKTLLVPDHRAKYLAAYMHNNPVRAAVVDSPEQSSWTSHRAYVGLETPIASLDVARGLAYFGCTPCTEGRARFHEYVVDRRHDPRDQELSGSTTQQARQRARVLHGSTAELATPVLERDSANYPVRVPIPAATFTGSATELLQRMALLLGVHPDELCGPGRRHDRARLRTIVVLVWRMLQRRSSEITAVLKVSEPAVSNMLARAMPGDTLVARQLLAQLLENGGG